MIEHIPMNQTYQTSLITTALYFVPQSKMVKNCKKWLRNGKKWLKNGKNLFSGFVMSALRFFMAKNGKND